MIEATMSNSDALARRAERYLDLLPESGDVLLVTLKGHLAVEEILYSMVSSRFANSKCLDKARLNFHQLTWIARGLFDVGEVIAPTWDAVAKLNALRNAFAHNLEPENIAKRIQDLVDASTLSGEVPVPV